MKWGHNILMTLPQRLILVCVCVSVCVSVKTIPCLWWVTTSPKSLRAALCRSDRMGCVFYFFWKKFNKTRDVIFTCRSQFTASRRRRTLSRGVCQGRLMKRRASEELTEGLFFVFLNRQVKETFVTVCFSPSSLWWFNRKQIFIIRVWEFLFRWQPLSCFSETAVPIASRRRKAPNQYWDSSVLKHKGFR